MRRFFAKWVGRAGDAKLERWFGSRLAQRVVFAAMAASFDPEAAAGFEGAISYEIQRPATGAPALRWTVEVKGPRARARRGAAENPALSLRVTVSDFVRIGAGTIDPAIPVLQGRASFRGDFGLAMRLPEMFRANPRRRARD